MNRKTLQTIRLHEELNQTEAAELLDVSQQTYSKYESGKYAISFERIESIKKAFNITDKEMMLLNEFKALRNNGGAAHE